jgi:hypothetical protein
MPTLRFPPNPNVPLRVSQGNSLALPNDEVPDGHELMVVTPNGDAVPTTAYKLYGNGRVVFREPMRGGIRLPLGRRKQSRSDHVFFLSYMVRSEPRIWAIELFARRNRTTPRVPRPR